MSPPSSHAATVTPAVATPAAAIFAQRPGFARGAADDPDANRAPARRNTGRMALRKNIVVVLSCEGGAVAVCAREKKACLVDRAAKDARWRQALGALYAFCLENGHR